MRTPLYVYPVTKAKNDPKQMNRLIIKQKMPNDNLDIIGVRITGRKTHQIRQGRKAFSCKSASPVRKSSGYTKHGLSLRHSPLTSPMRTSNMESKHKV